MRRVSRVRLSGSPTACLVAWSAALLALAVWLAATPPGYLRGGLIDLQFWWLDATCAAALVLTGLNLPRLLREMRERSCLREVAIWSLVAIALTAFAAPRIPRMFYDEQIYQDVGQNMADLHKAQFCNEGIVEYGRLTCIRGEYNKEPYAWPHLLSVVYRVIGVHEWIAHTMNNLSVGALVWAVAIVALVFARDRRAAIGAAAVAALIPQMLRWGNTGAAEPVATAAAACAVATAAWFVHTRSSAALGWMVATTVYAAQVRPESILIVPVVGAMLVFYARDELVRVRTWWWALVGLAFSALLIGHLFAMRNESWQAPASRFSLAHAKLNLPVNGRFFIADERFPFIYTVLFIAGLVAFDGRARAVLAFWFFEFWAIFVAFYAGSFDWGANVRYSVMTSPPIAIAAGRAIAALAGWIERIAPRVRRPERALLAAVVFQFLWYMPQVRDVGEESWAARADVRYARAFAARVPPDSMILTQNPNMFLLWGRNAAQVSIASTDPSYVQTQMLPRYRGGVYVHWNFWCNIPDKVQRDFCEAPLARFDAELVEEHEERDFRFALYRLSPRAEPH